MALECIKEVLSTSQITALVTLLAVCIGILYLIRKGKGLPPGPRGLPLVGYYPFLKDDGLHLQLTDLAKQYGDVYSLKIAGQLLIHLGSIKSIKETYVTKSDCFTDRYNLYSLFTVIFGRGMTAANGEEWKVLRKFFVQAFREYGLNSLKGYMAGPIYDCINASVDNLKATKGSPVNIIPIINDRSSDIFRLMMFNDNEITDEELHGVLQSYEDTFSTFYGRKILLMGDFARYFMFPIMRGHKAVLENHKKMRGYLATLVRRHEATYSEGSIRDVIDSYIKERRDRSKKGDPTAKYFTEDSLVYSLIQFVGDGIFGIALFMAHFIDSLLEHPEEQDKIYKELEEVAGENPQITLEHKSKLPYTQAFMQEVIRTTDFFTIFASMVCTKETTISGYRIPKGAITLTNFWSSQHDPDVYDEPYKFKPSRYLTEPGKPKTEAPIAFGVGKRSCAGEPFTMMQVFLFLTNIVKNFRLERPKGYEANFRSSSHLNVCAHPRK